jgi:hypothetical protein
MTPEKLILIVVVLGIIGIPALIAILAQQRRRKPK